MDAYGIWTTSFCRKCENSVAGLSVGDIGNQLSLLIADLDNRIQRGLDGMRDDRAVNQTVVLGRKTEAIYFLDLSCQFALDFLN